MAVTVTHATVATGVNDPAKQVSKDAWNEGHSIVGLGSAAEAATTDFDAAGTAAIAVATHEAAVDPHTGYQKESEKNAANGYAGLSAGSKLTGSQQTYGSAANTACEGNDSRLSDSRAPTGNAGGDLTGTYPDPTIGANKVTNAKFRQGSARTVVGVTGNASADVADIQGTTDQVLRVNGAGTALAFGAIDLSKAAAATGVLQAGSFPALTGDVTTSAGSLTTAIGSGKVTRTMLEATAKNWQFLGQATASGAVRTGTITWTGTFKQLWFEYFIAGYSNTAIGRLIVGPTAGLSETATNHCNSLIEGVTLTTTSVSVPGWPTATTVNNVPRYGHMFVQNVAASVKRMWGQGNHAGTAATAVPLQMQFAGLMSDATNAINKAELAVYDAITGATISTRTFNSGTYLNVWGRNDD